MKFLALTLALITAPLAAAAYHPCDRDAELAVEVMIQRQSGVNVSTFQPAFAILGTRDQKLLLVLLVDAWRVPVFDTMDEKGVAVATFEEIVLETCTKASGKPS